MIKIDDLIPLLKEGWVAMDKNKEWYWFEDKPIKNIAKWHGQFCENLSMFNIASAEDWTQSLIKIERKDK